VARATAAVDRHLAVVGATRGTAGDESKLAE
jgi:hypothetical protein